MTEARVHLIWFLIEKHFIVECESKYAEANYDKREGLPRDVGFIDRKVIGIARPTGNLPLLVVYNGHKRKHALEYQAVNAPDGLILHTARPIGGRRHD